MITIEQQNKTVIRQLDRLADMLSANVRPGHPDYISKSDAAKWLAQLIKEIK